MLIVCLTFPLAFYNHIIIYPLSPTEGSHVEPGHVEPNSTISFAPKLTLSIHSVPQTHSPSSTTFTSNRSSPPFVATPLPNASPPVPPASNSLTTTFPPAFPRTASKWSSYARIRATSDAVPPHNSCSGVCRRPSKTRWDSSPQQLVVVASGCIERMGLVI